ncbi:hypothetical protein BD408DRAFT_432994 [Parasitella parasitica]|nr:hypothetical protein BD408DRAFT_432994 [Parasitella parasitica]
MNYNILLLGSQMVYEGPVFYIGYLGFIDDLEQKMKQTVEYREKHVVAASDDDDHQDNSQRN